MNKDKEAVNFAQWLLINDCVCMLDNPSCLYYKGKKISPDKLYKKYREWVFENIRNQKIKLNI